MKKDLHSYTKSLIPFLVALPILILLNHPIKYVLFMLAVFLIFSVYVNLVSTGSKTVFQFWTGYHNFAIVRIFPYLLLAACSLLLAGASLFLIIVPGLILFVTTLLTSLFLSGYALMNLLGISDRFEPLEKIVLSFTVSYFLTALLVFFLKVEANSSYWLAIIYCIYFVLSLLSIAKELRRHRTFDLNSFSWGVSKDILGLLCGIVFFIIAVNSFFPDLSLSIGPDFVRHYWWTNILVRSPQLYTYQGYLWFHCNLAVVFNSVGSQPLESFSTIQTGLAYLGLMPIVAFYLMAKSYLKNVNKYLPSISTIFYSLFSGLTWIYFVWLKVSQSEISEVSALSASSDATYWQNMYTPGLRFWGFVPLIVSLTQFFVLMLLLNQKPSRRNQLLFIIIFVSMALTHLPEAVVFSIILSVFSFMESKENDRFRRALPLTVVGFLSIVIVFWSSAYKGYFVSNMATIVFLSTIVVASSYLFSKKYRLGVHLASMRYRRLLAPFLFVGFVLSIGAWIILAANFHIDTVTWSVPWYFYFPLLGINGLLAIFGIYYLEGSKQLSALWPFICLVFAVFILGIVVTYVNETFGIVVYWESRTLDFIQIGLAPLSALGVGKLFSIAWKKRAKTIPIFLISIIALSGLFSTFMAIEYWSYQKDSTSTSRLDSQELRALSYLDQTFSKNPYSTVITVTFESYHMLMFSSPPYLSNLYKNRESYTSSNPDTALYLLSTKLFGYAKSLPEKNSHLYVYVHERDRLYLISKYPYSYLLHLISNIKPIFENQEVAIYEVPNFYAPIADAPIIIILPSDGLSQPDYLLAYDMLAASGYQYTVAYDYDDFWTIKKEAWLPWDPSEETYKEKCWSYVESGGQLLVLNTNGNNLLFSALFNRSNVTLNVTSIAGNCNISIPATPILVSQPKLASTVTSYYGDSTGDKTPFATETVIGKGKITYVNIHPLIRQNNKTKAYSILADLLKVLGKQGTNKNNFEEIDNQLTFRKAYLNGTTTINTNSVLFPNNMGSLELNVTKGEERLLFSNVTSIRFTGYTNASIMLKQAEIADGKGLYVPITTTETATLKFTGNNISAIIQYGLADDVKELEILGPSIEISACGAEKLVLYSRNPFIHVDGYSTFYDLHVDYLDLLQLAHATEPWQNELTLSGLNFQICYSAQYSTAGRLSW